MDAQSPTTTLRQVPLFHDLTADELARVENIAISRFYRKKTVIFTEGSGKEAVFFISDGLVKAFRTDEDGNEQIVSLLKTGDMFPHVGLFNKDPYPATTEAIVDTRVLAIPVLQFEHLLLDTPAIAVKIMTVLGAKIKELQDMLQEFRGHDVNRRALSFLLKLAERHGEWDDDTVRIRLPITHREFADAIGASRETVSRLLTQLRKEGILQTGRHRMTIVNMEALKRWKDMR